MAPTLVILGSSAAAALLLDRIDSPYRLGNSIFWTAVVFAVAGYIAWATWSVVVSLAANEACGQIF